MKPRMVWIEATVGRPELAGLWDFLRAYLADLAGDRVDVTMCHVARDAGGVRHPATRLLSDGVALAAAREAAADADVLVYGCWGAPTAEARALIDVPVTGLTEASVRLGATLATRPAVVTVAEGLRPTFARDLAALGAELPILWLDPPSSHTDVLDAVADPAPLIDRFDRVARRAVDGGADAILVGCGYFGPIFSAHGYRSVGGSPDVPVLDCAALAFGFGALLADLHARGQSASRRGYPPVPAGASAALHGTLDRLGS